MVSLSLCLFQVHQGYLICLQVNNIGDGRGGKGGRSITKNANTVNRIKKTIEDYYFYVGSSKQASDYETIVEFAVNHIKKTFERGNDIAESLRILVKEETASWDPILQISTSSDADDKVREHRQNDMNYKSELDEALKRNRIYENNIFKTQALLQERYAKAMKNKLMS